MKENIEKVKSNVDEIFLSYDNIPHVAVRNGKRHEYYPVDSDETSEYINYLMYMEDGVPPGSDGLRRIKNALSAIAKFEGDKHPTFHRVARTSKGIEIDLNNTNGECVCITENNWFVTQPSARFVRTERMLELPYPLEGGSWDLIEKHIRTQDTEDSQLLFGYLLGCLKPEAPYPALILQGEQGCAKTTATRFLKELVDPSKDVERKISNKEEDIFIAAKREHLLSFDNVSHIQGSVSDILCRVLTGGTFAARKLFSNDGERSISLSRPIVLNGIEDFVNRPDLNDRAITVNLERINQNERKTKEKTDADFQADKPYIFGALLDGLSSALRNNDKVHLQEKPRMADLVHWCTAAEEGVEWKRFSFADAFEKNQRKAIINNITNDPVAVALQSFMKDLEKEYWEGTASELLAALEMHKPPFSRDESWPKNAAYMSGKVNRIKSNLREVGIEIHNGESVRTSQRRAMKILKLDHFDSGLEVDDQELDEAVFDDFDENVLSFARPDNSSVRLEDPVLNEETFD